MRVLVIADGDLKLTKLLRAAVDTSDLVICADGATRKAHELDIKVDIIVGDLDSLKPTQEERKSYLASGIELIELPVDKDETDLEAAIDVAVMRGAIKITIAGIGGGRIDHALGNLLILSNEKFKAISIEVIDGDFRGLLLKDKASLSIENQIGSLLSLIPLSENVFGVSICGAKWTLDNETLHLGSPRTISNVIAEDKAQISMEKGAMFVFHEDK